MRRLLSRLRHRPMRHPPKRSSSGEAPVASFTKILPQLFRGDKVDLLPPADSLLAALEEWPSLDTMGRVRQGIAENPALINKKTNERFGGRWKVGEGVFALSPQELKTLALDARESTLVKPYHDLRDVDRFGQRWIRLSDSFTPQSRPAQTSGAFRCSKPTCRASA